MGKGSGYTGGAGSSTTSLDSFMCDLEVGGHTQTMRAQSKRLSALITSRTELFALNPVTPDPPKAITEDDETSGFAYWWREVQSAQEHGGDYQKRLESAIRAALGSFLTFSILIFPQQQYLGAVWIGNIFMHSNIQDSLGACLTSVQGFGTSIVLTTIISWPIGFFMSWLDTWEAAIVMPFAVFFVSFFIMSCPQLTARNLMILVMYIIVATNVREEIQWWEPLGWTATYLIGLGVAVLMNIFPTPNSSLAATHTLLKGLEQDLTMLLVQCKAYADNTATTPGISRAAIASIELLHARITKSLKSLKGKMPATRVELGIRFNSEAAADLEQWINEATKLEAHLQSLRTALTQKVLGEEHHAYSSNLRAAKQAIKEEIGPARDRMVDAMIASVAVCHAWADPFAKRSVMPDVLSELEDSVWECRKAFHRAMAKAAEKLDDQDQTGNNPVMAHLTRRMSAFHALFELGESIVAYLKKHRWEAEEIESSSRCSFWGIIMGMFSAFVSFTSPEWLWHKKDARRLAIKTSVGMFLAALFVSVPYLWNISSPFGIWPGLTIASVNLGNTGSSFHKASDRLFGTLLAAAYALLVSDLFPGNKDYVKIPAISFFTFCVLYLKNAEHAYKYTYAATSIGSMLYGSVKNDFNVHGYIPKRIELIFVGIVIFSFVELLLFPRSSRKIVESKGFDFFLTMRDFLKQTAISTQRMEDFVDRTKDNPDYYSNSLFGDPGEAFQLDKLDDSLKKLKAESAKLKAELESGLREPLMGLSLPLNAESFRGMVKEQGECVLYGTLLVKTLKELAKYYKQDGHPMREMNWPHLHTEFLTNALKKSEYTCEWLKSACPDGRLRPQNGNSVKTVMAAASFRGFSDVRLESIAKWSENYSQFLREKGLESSDPVAVMTLGISVTYILEICRHLQKAGSHVEYIAHNFPSLSTVQKQV